MSRELQYYFVKLIKIIYLKNIKDNSLEMSWLFAHKKNSSKQSKRTIANGNYARYV